MPGPYRWAIDLPQIWLFAAVMAFCFGACVGSFLNVCIYRIPKDESVVWPRSHCMTCGHTLPWYLNIPVLSYFMLRGKCHFCKEPFSFRYAFVELFTACLFVLPLLAFPPLVPTAAGTTAVRGLPPLGLETLASPWMIPVLWIFLSGLVIATFVDFDERIIPDSVSIGGMAAGLAASALVPELQGARTPLCGSMALRGLALSGVGLAAGVVVLLFVAVVLGKLLCLILPYLRERVKEEGGAMGMGDVKFLGAIGAFFGWKAVLFTLVVSSFVGALAGIVQIAVGKGEKGLAIPFGPYLAVGAFVWAFWGPGLWNWYLSLLAPAAA